MIVPLEIYKVDDDFRDGYVVLCRVRIRNKEFRMLVDTGASMTFFNIDKSTQISQNELESNQQEIRGLGNSNIKSKYVVIDEMKISDIVINEYKTILIDLEHINGFFKKRGDPFIDGVIGGDILYKYNAIIDYKNREMILSL